ncbi:hypothetical protein Ocin01_07374 [Orchesella cincta]|uniref:Uncharacterized protein n=1 Tax=Orchesella cincta TaxID=48709 RepID=A0A1D2N1Z1_ORCCI|nr:hypothetical protein Ocin01_07374 [Orchesella cincta]
MPNTKNRDVSRTGKGFHRPRSRERDQRVPTFQVLEKLHHNNNPAEIKRVEPPPTHHPVATQKRKSKSPHSTSPAPTARRHSHHEAPKDRNQTVSYSPGRKSIGSDGSSSGGSGGNSRRSSINSGRGPACSFASQFQLSSDQRSRSYSPKRKFSPGRNSGEEKLGEEDELEPSDVIVWDTARKASRSNLLCPLTDSEFRGVNIIQTKTRILKQYNVDKKSKSAPKSCRFTQSSVAIPLDEPGKTETLDDQLPPLSPKEASSTVSIHSTSKHKIDLIGKQLDEIYYVQNDILNQLEDSIASTQTENLELQNEILALKHNNKNLVYLLNDMTDELERMKHIFRSRGHQLPVHSSRTSSIPVPTRTKENENTQTSPSSSAGPQQQRSRSREKTPSVKSTSPSPGHKRRSSRESDSVKQKQEAKPSQATEGRGEAPLEISVIKDRKTRGKGAKQEHCNALDPYHSGETDSSIFRNDSENSVNALGEGMGTIIAGSERSNKKRSRDDKTNSSTKSSSRDRRKSSASNKDRERSNNNYACKDDGTSTRASVNNSKGSRKSNSRGGCFGFFNLFRSKPPYARDSDDNVVTLNDL